jgi:hypothetical protein
LRGNVNESETLLSVICCRVRCREITYTARSRCPRPGHWRCCLTQHKKKNTRYHTITLLPPVGPPTAPVVLPFDCFFILDTVILGSHYRLNGFTSPGRASEHLPSSTGIGLLFFPPSLFSLQPFLCGGALSIHTHLSRPTMLWHFDRYLVFPIGRRHVRYYAACFLGVKTFSAIPRPDF